MIGLRDLFRSADDRRARHGISAAQCVELLDLVVRRLLLYFSFFAGGAPDAGWFAYTPLSEKPYSSLAGCGLLDRRRCCIGHRNVAAAINFAVTIICHASEGMTMRRLPLFVWMTLINSFLMIWRLPAAQRRAGDAA